MNEQWPWPAAVITVAMFIGIGCTYLLYADRLCDWQIRLLKSPRMRLFYRIMGGMFVALGLVFAWLFATNRLS